MDNWSRLDIFVDDWSWLDDLMNDWCQSSGSCKLETSIQGENLQDQLLSTRDIDWFSTNNGIETASFWGSVFDNATVQTIRFN